MFSTFSAALQEDNVRAKCSTLQTTEQCIVLTLHMLSLNNTDATVVKSLKLLVLLHQMSLLCMPEVVTTIAFADLVVRQAFWAQHSCHNCHAAIYV